MNFAPDTFDVDKISLLLYRCMAEIRENPNLFPMTFGLQNGSEKTGCLIGLENETVCIQEYVRENENAFAESDRISFFSLESIVTLQIHKAAAPEIFGMFWKKRWTGIAISKLAVRRDFSNMLAEVTGLADTVVEILWDTMDTNHSDIVGRFAEFLKTAANGVRRIHADNLGKEAWARQVRKVTIRGSKTENATLEDNVLILDFCNSPVRGKTVHCDIDGKMERLL